MTHIVGQHIVAHRFLRRQLQFAGHGGVDLEAVAIGVFTVALQHLLAHHLRQVGRGEGDFRTMVARFQRFAARFDILLLRDVVLIEHTRQHHVPTRQRAGMGIERVESRRRFRQPGDHRHFAQGQLIDIFTEIDLCGGADAVSAVTQIDLIQIELKNFIFAE